jgi:peroxiredoxin
VAATLTIGTVSGFMAAAILVVAGTRWLRLMRQVRVPEDRRGFVAACAVAAALGGAAFVLETNLAGGIAAGLAVEGGLAFLVFSAASGQPALAPAVAVGGPVLDFVATDDEGRPFDLALLRGQPFLLKFFRGHWCPYCTAELRRWEELRPELDARGIRVVAVCADTAAQIRAGRGKHGLQATMVPDPTLAVTDRYNLRSPRNFAPKPGVIIPLPQFIASIPLAVEH